MTSEVAVLTKQCVVLAADSALTTEDGKIFHTVNKVFALSKHEPVGIMAYSSAEVMGVPVETAIKEFRRIRGREACEHLEGYAEAFEDFLRNDNSVFSEDGRCRSLAALAWQCVAQLRSRSYDKLANLARRWGHPTKTEARHALLQGLAEYEESANASQALDVSNPRKARRSACDAIEEQFKNAIEKLREELPVSASTQRRIHGLVLNHCLRDVDSGVETGFVVTGLGTSDVFPRLRAFEFCHSAMGIHKVRSRQDIDINDKLTAQIEPFGQSDVMETFVEGMARDYMRAVGSFLEGFFGQKKAEFEDNAPEVAQFVDKLGGDLSEELRQHLRRFRQERFVAPLMAVVASMPKEELAILAEALVNLTALKRRASREEESVGGPIDVAVISKGDGFIWVKRKHYFDASLNPAFGMRHLERTNEG